MSLNRNTHTTRLYTDQLTKIQSSEFCSNLNLYSTEGQRLSTCWFKHRAATSNRNRLCLNLKKWNEMNSNTFHILSTCLDTMLSALSWLIVLIFVIAILLVYKEETKTQRYTLSYQNENLIKIEPEFETSSDFWAQVIV